MADEADIVPKTALEYSRPSGSFETPEELSHSYNN